MTTDSKQSAQQTGADIVVKTLEQNDVKWVFGIPGAKIDKVFNTLVDSSIQTVVCRHEQNAAFIAGGIGRMTGKAGVAIATSGPGVSNLVTGFSNSEYRGRPHCGAGRSCGRFRTAQTDPPGHGLCEYLQTRNQIQR